MTCFRESAPFRLRFPSFSIFSGHILKCFFYWFTDVFYYKSGGELNIFCSELTLKCATPLDAVKWKTAILESMNGVGRIWREPHPYGSTFPLRRTQSVQWLAFITDLYPLCSLFCAVFACSCAEY